MRLPEWTNIVSTWARAQGLIAELQTFAHNWQGTSRPSDARFRGAFSNDNIPDADIKLNNASGAVVIVVAVLVNVVISGCSHAGYNQQQASLRDLWILLV